MHYKILKIVTVLLVLVQAGSALATYDTYQAKVVGITDGDTIKVLRTYDGCSVLS